MAKKYKVYFKIGKEKPRLIKSFNELEKASTFIGIESTQMETQGGTFLIKKDNKIIEKLKVR